MRSDQRSPSARDANGATGPICHLSMNRRLRRDEVIMSVSHSPSRLAPLSLAVTILAVVVATAVDPSPGQDVASVAQPAAHTSPALTLVESSPIETPLDHPDIPDAYEIWPEMLGSATSTIDLAEFYASDDPGGSGSRLENVVRTVEMAADRGVRIRFLAEEKFYHTYPETLDRLGRRRNIEVRRFNVARLMGGVHHAKYFIVDGREAYLGSQNFDWRSLTHIQELGLRLKEASLVLALSDIFEMDWALAAADAPQGRPRLVAHPARFPVRIVAGHDTSEVGLVASPQGWLPDPSLWDLPQIVKIIDSAQRTVRVQLLTYKTTERDGAPFEDLESAILRAASRGVDVRLLLADWCMRPGTIEGLKRLEPIENVAVKLLTIPQWSGGFVPYARVAHAKYLVADGSAAWLGTSNWEKGYFYDSRNVGLVIRGGSIPTTLDRFFLDGWNGPYAATVDPDRTYAAPRIGE